MASLATTPVSEDEYLRQERLAETKSEFHDEQVFAMSGGSPTHAFLCNRMGALLDRKVPSGCRVYNSDLRIKIARAKTYTYANGSVVCGELGLAGDQRDNLLNPILIVEVLSPSSEGYDRGKKFEMYGLLRAFANTCWCIRTACEWSTIRGNRMVVGCCGSMPAAVLWLRSLVWA